MGAVTGFLILVAAALSIGLALTGVFGALVAIFGAYKSRKLDEEFDKWFKNELGGMLVYKLETEDGLDPSEEEPWSGS